MFTGDEDTESLGTEERPFQVHTISKYSFFVLPLQLSASIERVKHATKRQLCFPMKRILINLICTKAYFYRTCFQHGK